MHSLVKLFSGDVSFEKLQRGDRYRVLYEVHVDKLGEIVRNGKILGAEVVTARQVARARSTSGTRTATTATTTTPGSRAAPPAARVIGFYPPLREALITSGFSSSRRHPLFGFVRPHHGVDLAAPHGTPIRAIADGRVLFAHWHGQLGHAVRIEHGGSPAYASTYGHLSRIEEDVTRGAWVRRGQVIGYVGGTGAATGPHLHLSVRCDGELRRPAPGAPLRQADRRARERTTAFEAEKKSSSRSSPPSPSTAPST